MPRWKALPEGLDPQVREFAGQLRRLVDRSGLGIAAVADRTGYSRTSWERYLNGRLLAPKGAIVALAEVTGANPLHLTTMWELAERAWSRSEMRHDMTMEAIRISQARAALGEFGPAPAAGVAAARGKGAGPGTAPYPGGRGGPGTAPPPVPGTEAGERAGEVAPSPRRAAEPGAAPGPLGAQAGPSEQVPPQRQVADPGPGQGTDRTAPPTRPTDRSPDRERRRRRLVMFLAGVVGALVVIAAVLFLPGLGDDPSSSDAKPAASRPAPSAPARPDGVRCAGQECAGRDPESMGCSGELARTTESAVVGTRLVEVRYSKTCGAAWARITQAGPGDEITVSATGQDAADARRAKVGSGDEGDTYTPMVVVEKPAEARACAVVAADVKGCTT